MIKKIVFSLPSSTINLYRMQFSTKINGEWAIYDIGNYIGTIDANGIKFDNITVACDKYTGTDIIGLRNPFLYTGSGASLYSGMGNLTITFNEGLRVLSGIYYGFYSGVPTKVSVYDENDVLLYENTAFTKMTTPALDYAKQFLETTELQVMKVYPTNVVGTIETNDNTQISNIYQIDGITVSQVTPDNTDIRYLLSFDGRNTYKAYKNGLWLDVDISDIMSQGLTKDELESLTKTEFAEAITNNKTLDILVGMTTQSEYSTPSISGIKVLYLRIV